VVYARPMVSDAVTDLLWEPRPTILCHPSLLVGDSAADPAALIRANEILHVRIEDTPRYGTWSQFVTQNAIAGVDVERGLVFDTANLAAQYAMSGEGIALLDPLLYAEEIRAGRLAAPFSATVDHGFGYFLITQPDDLGDVAIATFRSWLIQRFGGSDAARERQAVRLVHSVG
jgi:DNA-binding transcriptional LysR family regulator